MFSGTYILFHGPFSFFIHVNTREYVIFFAGCRVCPTNYNKPQLTAAIKVYAHKLLCMRCSYFRAMFDGQMREARGV